MSSLVGFIVGKAMIQGGKGAAFGKVSPYDMRLQAVKVEGEATLTDVGHLFLKAFKVDGDTLPGLSKRKAANAPLNGSGFAIEKGQLVEVVVNNTDNDHRLAIVMVAGFPR